MRLAYHALFWFPVRLRLEYWRFWERRLHPLHPGHAELRLLILDLEAFL